MSHHSEDEDNEDSQNGVSDGDEPTAAADTGDCGTSGIHRDDQAADAGDGGDGVLDVLRDAAIKEREKEIPLGNDVEATQKELTETSTATPTAANATLQSRDTDHDDSAEKEQTMQSAVDASAKAAAAPMKQASSSKGSAEMIREKEVDTLADMEMRLVMQNEKGMFAEGSKTHKQHTSTFDPDQPRGATAVRGIDGATSTRMEADGNSTNRDNMPATSNRTSAMSEGAMSTVSHASTVVSHTIPTDLSRGNPRTNQHVMRPGAIRVVQGDGGAYLERPDVMLEATTEFAPEPAARGDIESDATSQYPNAIAATLVDESFDGDGGRNYAQIEEARRIGEEETRREILKDAVVANVAAGDEKSRMGIYLIIASICVVIVVGAVVGGVVGSTASGGGSPSSDRSALITVAPTTLQPTVSSASPSVTASATPSRVPSSSPSSIPSSFPTMQPTAKASSNPTTSDNIAISRKIDRVVRTVSHHIALEETFTFQYAALQWLLVEDRWITLETEEQLIKERYIVILFALTTLFENWRDKYDFLNPETSVCEWSGKSFNPVSQIPALSCNDLGRVRSVSLVTNNLNGIIAAEFGFLESLDTLHLGSNNLKGRLQPELGQLTNLQVLQLGFNDLTSVLPSELGNLQVLRELFLDSNSRLSGDIPFQLSLISTLNNLVVEGTGLTNMQIMCAPGKDWWMFRSDCQSPTLTCTCCTQCCSNGSDCEANDDPIVIVPSLRPDGSPPEDPGTPQPPPITPPLDVPLVDDPQPPSVGLPQPPPLP